MNEDGDCAFCGERTSNHAGDPGLWPLFFCHPDGTGVGKVHHTRCVVRRLFDDGAQELLKDARAVINGEVGERYGALVRRIDGHLAAVEQGEKP